jgi:hypothetical protein
MEENTNTKKPVEAGLNKYGQRLDEFNEFGQSLEAEAWHEGAFEASIAPVYVLERLIRPARKKKQTAADNSMPPSVAHRRAV